MKRDWVIGLVVAAMAASACGGDDTKPPTTGGRRPTDNDASIVRPDRDAGIDAGGDPRVDAGELTTDAGMTTNNGPILEVTSPAQATSPNDEAVHTAPSILVRCKASQREGGATVDQSSIQISLEKQDSDSSERITAPATAKGGDEFEARFEVGAMQNGLLRFHCQAKDLAKPAASSAIVWTTYLDLGPNISIKFPENLKNYALKTPVPIEFRVTPAPLGDGDEKAGVRDVKLQVSGRPISVTESSSEPGLYQTSVDFNDRTIFPAAPPNAEILVTATNNRTPTSPVRSLKHDIVIDSAGPTIKVESPALGTVIRGKRELVVTVTDASGVEPGSVVAIMSAVLKDGKDLVISDNVWNVTGSTYRALFDTGNFESFINQVTFQISATDTVGNITSNVPHSLVVDNMPPVLSLDPPDIREWREVSKNPYCSRLFDPVGTDAVNDLDVVPSTFAQLRVLVEDQGNVEPGQRAVYFAGVDRASVTVWAQGDPSVPLLIDTNGDGVCDEINNSAINSELGDKNPTSLQLEPVTPRGSPWYAKTLEPDAPCTPDPNGAVDPPGELCLGQPLTRIVPGRSTDKPPAVYGFQPSNNMGLECSGKQWMVGNIVGLGWACFAARAQDLAGSTTTTKGVGNVAVSPPIRICFESPDPMVPDPDCKTGIEPPPSCTQNCTVPNYPSGMIWRQQ